MIVESILELHETNATDENIKSYDYDEYPPFTSTQFNRAGHITITTENQDQFLHLHNSYLLIERDVLKGDNTRYADADLVALTNNGLLYLFFSLKLTLVSRAIHQHIIKDVDWYKVGFQISALMQLLLILGFLHDGDT